MKRYENKFYFHLFVLTDSIVHSWAFTSTPYPLLTVFAIYLWIIYKVLPKFMENRKPYDLTQITRIYNIYQIAACTFFVEVAFRNGFSFKELWKCTDEPKYVGFVTEFDMKSSYYQWWYLFLRLSEFLETLFFILRKKFNQVSVLHVYHHMAVPFLLWIFLNHSGDRMGLVIVVVNSAVHVAMYAYYFLSSFRKIQKYTNLVKPVITAIQIIQLIVLWIHCIIALLPGCNASKLFTLQVANLAILIFMFLRFYSKSYLTNKVKSN